MSLLIDKKKFKSTYFAFNDAKERYKFILLILKVESYCSKSFSIIIFFRLDHVRPTFLGQRVICDRYSFLTRLFIYKFLCNKSRNSSFQEHCIFWNKYCWIKKDVEANFARYVRRSWYLGRIARRAKRNVVFQNSPGAGKLLLNSA